MSYDQTVVLLDPSFCKRLTPPYDVLLTYAMTVTNYGVHYFTPTSFKFHLSCRAQDHYLHRGRPQHLAELTSTCLMPVAPHLAPALAVSWASHLVGAGCTTSSRCSGSVAGASGDLAFCDCEPCCAERSPVLVPANRSSR